MRIRDFCAAIEAAAERCPDRIAVEDATGATTYGGLDRAAGRMARGLLASGLERGAPVGLFLPAGRAYVEAFVAVAKAGGVMMPLDVGLPPARLRQVLRRSKCELAIAGGERPLALLRARLAAAGCDGAVAAVTAAELAVAGEASDDDGLGEHQEARPEDPCYIMFTSGSSGEPRAVLGCHRGLAHFLRWEIGELELDDGVRVSMLAPTTFDVSLRDMLVPLCLGGTLCIPGEAVRTNPRRLLAWLGDSRITLTHIVPTLFRLLLAELEMPAAPRPASLRHVLLAGEPLYGADVARWRRLAGRGAALVNLYGPTETTLAKAFFRLGEQEIEAGRMVPIGGPLPDTALLLLDGGRLCARGEIGEIHIKTPYRSLGYLNDPGQTAAVFVDNPLNPGKGDVLYRTGDLGRYLAGGEVECLGRLDQQLKINGVRIEPAEIESAVRRFPGIVDTVVVGQPTAARQVALTCYYQPRPGESGPQTADALRRHLRDELPGALVPTFFVAMAELPYTVSGKVARRLLPKPEELLYEIRPYAAPADPLEERLAALWSEVLGIRRVGVEHSYAELGGDSLKAIRLTSAVYRAFGVDLSLKELFDLGTVRAVAGALVRAGKDGTGGPSGADGQAGVTAAPEPVPPIPAAAAAADYAVSHAQRRIWTLHQMDIDSVAYNLPVAFRIRGPLDVERLRGALAAVVARHEALRTTFAMVEGELRQRVADAGAGAADRPGAALPVVDLAAVAWEAAAAGIVAGDRGRPFDLARGPLLRASLLRLAAADHILVFNIHHIVCDVWSLGIMVRELRSLYAAPRTALAPLRLQYRDFAAWQNGRLAESRPEREYWLGRLAGELPRAEVKADHPRPPVQTFNGNTVRRPLGGELTDRLIGGAAAMGASAFVVLQAVVKALLFRLTGERRLVIGSPVLGRQHPEMQEQVGLYVNTLALDDRVEAELSFADLVARVQRTTLEAVANQGYPFDVLVDELRLPRDMSHSPLFDIMIVFQEEDPEPLTLEGTRIAYHGQENAWNFSRFDLVFHFSIRDGELILDLNYNTDLYRRESVERLAAQLVELAGSALAAPDRRLDGLALLPDAERALIASFSRGASEPREAPGNIVERFAARVAAAPGALALLAGERSMTYAQLDERSDSLARFLRGRGIERGERVGVTARRSISGMGGVAAMLGIMKAGAAYVPIDAELPPERFAALLADSGCRLLLSGDETPDADEDAKAVAAPPLGSQDVAYVIYTSGSTGEPKGVLVTHGGFVNMALAQIAAFGITPADRVLQFAAASFDAALAETFSALLSGAALVLVPREVVERPADFLAFLERFGVTVMTLPPVYLGALDRAPMPGVRVLISAGEAAREGDAALYAGTKRFFNAYGPTETSVCATLFQVAPGGASGAPVPIGRPLANTSVMVLDERQEPLPIGVAGEIAVAGPGLARGYHAQAAATAASFVPHPSGRGERLYRTGDRGRWRADGELEYLGRRDEQVKVHGHRVELGAVARALRGVPGVGEAFVTTTATPDGDALAGYYTRQRRIEPWPSVAEFLVYDDVLYGSMAADEGRNRRYRAAFGRHLAGRRVVEIGPGAELVLSRLALDAGAEHVYAIEILRETYERARARIAELGLADRITLLHGDARHVEIGERVDYCISEIVGGIGGSEGAAAIINAARRFLVQPDRMLPRRSVTWFAAAALPEAQFDYRFSEIAAHYVHEIFAQIGQPFDLRLCLKHFPRENLLSAAAVFEDLDYTREVALATGHEVSLAVARQGEMSGFLVWLQLHVDEREVVDILGQEASWLPVYLPAFAAPVSVSPGDVVELTVSRHPCEDGLHPDYFLRGRLRRQSGETVPIECESRHRPHGLGQTPFYRRLFPGGEMAIAADLTDAGIREALAARLTRHEIPAWLVRLDRLPLNGSGKVDRRQLPDPRGAAGDAAAASTTSPTSAGTTGATGAKGATELVGVEARIAAAWREVLGRPVGPDDNFFSLGGDSIKAIRIVSLLHAQNVKLEVRDIFRQPTVRRCAAGALVGGTSIDQRPVTGEVAATPIVRWFFDRFHRAPHHFNQSVILRSAERLSPPAVERALAAILRHHDALRLRFPRAAGEPRRGTIDGEASPVWLEEISREEWSARAAEIQGGFDLDRGPLVRAVRVRLPEGEALWLLCHHLIVDVVSWGILLADFSTAYDRALAGAEIVLPPKTHSYRDYAAALAGYAAQGGSDSERGYWMALHDVPGLPPAMAPDVGEAAPRQAALDAALSEDETARLLLAARGVFNGDVRDLLLTALALALHEWRGIERILVDLESHGRALPFDGVDVSRTVGWFTSFFPFLLDLPDLGSAHRVDALERWVGHVRDRLRQVPAEGIGYGVLARLAAERLPALHPAIGFNYLGELETGAGGGGGNGRDGGDGRGRFVVDWSTPGPSGAEEEPPIHALDLLAFLHGGRLEINLTHDGRRIETSDAESLLTAIRAALSRLAEAALGVDPARPVPADFTFSALSLADLDQIVADLPTHDERRPPAEGHP